METPERSRAQRRTFPLTTTLVMGSLYAAAMPLVEAENETAHPDMSLLQSGRTRHRRRLPTDATAGACVLAQLLPLWHVA
jgi:hypothetical protein